MLHPIETTNRESIAAFSFNKLNVALQYLHQHSAFYQKHFEKHHIKLDAIRSISDFQKIPSTHKSDLAQFNNDFMCVPLDDIAEWTTTSGTLGQPVSYGMTKNDLLRLAKNEARSLAITNCTSADRVQLMVTLDKRFMAGLAYYLGAQEYGCTTIRVGSGSPGLQIDSIFRFKPTVLIAVPSFLLKVCAYAKLNDADLSKSSIAKIICIGEPIRNVDFSLNNLGQRLQQELPKVSLFSTYASTELSTAMTECEQQCGGHIPPELVYIEVLDTHQDRVVADGELGELTFTSLGVEGMPLLRYRTGDICRKEIASCACGLQTARLSPIVGREQQMLKYKGTTLFPEAIYEVLNALKWIKEYVVVLEDSALETDEITLLLSKVASVNLEVALSVLEDELRAKIRVKPIIKIVSELEIRKVKFPSSSRKPLKLIDNRRKNHSFS